MVDAADLKSVDCNGRASSSLATPTALLLQLFNVFVVEGNVAGSC